MLRNARKDHLIPLLYTLPVLRLSFLPLHCCLYLQLPECVKQKNNFLQVNTYVVDNLGSFNTKINPEERIKASMLKPKFFQVGLLQLPKICA